MGLQCVCGSLAPMYVYVCACVHVYARCTLCPPPFLDVPPVTDLIPAGAGECLVLHFGGVGARAAVGAAIASAPLAGSAFLVAGGATTSALEKCFEATDEG